MLCSLFPDGRDMVYRDLQISESNIEKISCTQYIVMQSEYALLCFVVVVFFLLFISLQCH